MIIPFVDLKTQYKTIREEIDTAISEVISSCAFIGGQYVKSFENDFADYCNVKHCVGVGNGTDALFVALKILDIGKGDEVITAANTFIATSEAITLTGAKVVFVDINPRTYNIDVDKIEEKINENTKAIVPVHLFGQPADMNPILSIAKKNNLKIVCDAAQAHGAHYEGQPIASLCNLTCFSFYPGKNLGAYGDAGAIVTNDDELAMKARMISNHGRSEKYNHSFEGINSRMDGIQAAILRVKLNHLERWTENRRQNAYTYNKHFTNYDIITPEEIDNVRAVYHLYVIRIKPDLRKPLIDFLKKNGISTGIHYPIALPYLNAYAYLKHTENDFPVAFKASQEIVSLPMFPELKDSQIEYIVDKTKEFGL